MKRCTQCVLPESYPGITFTENGVCNYCLAYKRRKYRGEEQLKKILDSYSGQGKDYDCIVGVSGGRDSSYMLWYVVKVLNLRALACFVDNRFATEQAKLNLTNMTDILNVDLVVEEHDFVKRCVKHTIRSWMRKPSPGTIAFLCAGCHFGIGYGLLKTAQKYQIPLLITGSGEPSGSFAQQFLSTNPCSRRKFSLVVGFLSEIAKNPFYIKSPICLITYAQDYITRWSPFLRRIMMKKVEYPDLKDIAPFRYIGWDEKEMVSVIRDELGWETGSHSKSTWRSDCKIALLKNYLYKSTVGFTKIDELLSNMIREGTITREGAMERLKNESVIPQDFIVDFFDELGLDFSDLDVALGRAREKSLTRGGFS